MLPSVPLSLLEKERVCVLSVVMPDGIPHAAVVHYSSRADPLTLFIQTSSTLKTEAIKARGGSTDAAVVIGFDEEAFVTLQMHGTVSIVRDEEALRRIYGVHYAKHPDAEQHKGPQTIFLAFTPGWWRYTDLKTDPKTILASA